MDSGTKQAKSTGYTPPIKTGKGNGLARQKSTGGSAASPVSSNAPMRDASKSTPVEPPQILAIQILMGDYRELKDKLPAAWQAGSNGKIYWCASIPGHKLSIVNGELYIDDVQASFVLEKLLAV